MSIHHSPYFSKPHKITNSPFKTDKFRDQHRYRSQSPNRSLSNTSRNHINNNNSHNTSSIHSEYLKNAIQQVQLFPPLCMQMIKHEQRNMLQFKKSITKQKNRVNSQIQATLVQVSHIVQDYRLSLIAILDRIYQQYISKYTQLKTQIAQINRMKQQIQHQYPIMQHNHSNIKNNISNIQTLKIMQANQNQLKKFHLMNYVAELQKDKVGILNQVSQYLMILRQYDNGFFQIQEFRKCMYQTKQAIKNNFRLTLGQAYLYIRDPDNIAFKQVGKSKINNQISVDQERQRQASYPQIQGMNMQYNPKRRQPHEKPHENGIITDNQYSFHTQRQRQQFQDSNRYPFRQQQGSILQVAKNYSSPNYQQLQPQASKSQPYLLYNRDRDSQTPIIRNEYSQQNFKDKIPPINLNPNQINTPQIRKKLNSAKDIHQKSRLIQNKPNYHSQVLVSSNKISGDSIKVLEQTPFSFKSKAMDVILCCLYIDSNLTAVGSKDGSLLFYDRNGNVIYAHHNVHKSPVCTLKLVNNGKYLATGSDHPNPQIILWDLNSYNFDLYCRLKQHKGAVTAIQCLQDNQHMISGSYDKKLCVYSITQKKLKYTLPSNKHSVTALTLNCTGTKIISCCLQNNSLNIWQIVRSPTLNGINKVQTIFLEQVVQNNTMICSVVSSATRPNLVYIGTKDGTLKIVDIQKSQTVKNMNCCNNAIIQMLIIQQSQGLPIIICWPCKEKCFKMVDCQTSKVLNINTRGKLDFSCGVGPKASVIKDGLGFVVCSQSDDREIYWYKINRVI